LRKENIEIRKEDIAKLDNKKINAKFDKLQWLIIAVIMSIFLKDFIIK